MDRLPPVEWFHEHDICVLRIPDTPKSVNRVGQRGSWRTVHFEKKRWQEIIEKYLLMARLPRPLPHFLRVEAVMVFPTKHRRDAGNFKAPLEKALGDALVNGRWLPDDTPRWWEFKEFRFADHVGANTTIITLDYGKETDHAA
jgi:hypothetical protein